MSNVNTGNENNAEYLDGLVKICSDKKKNIPFNNKIKILCKYSENGKLLS